MGGMTLSNSFQRSFGVEIRVGFLCLEISIGSHTRCVKGPHTRASPAHEHQCTNAPMNTENYNSV